MISNRFNNITDLLCSLEKSFQNPTHIPGTVKRAITTSKFVGVIPESVEEMTVGVLDANISFIRPPLKLTVGRLSIPNPEHLPYITRLRQYSDYDIAMTNLEVIENHGGVSEPIPGVRVIDYPRKCHHPYKSREHTTDNMWTSIVCRDCRTFLEASSAYGTKCSPIPSCKSFSISWWYDVKEVVKIFKNMTGSIGTIFIRATPKGMNDFSNAGYFDLIPPSTTKVEIYLSAGQHDGVKFVGVKKIYPFIIYVVSDLDKVEVEDYTGIDETCFQSFKTSADRTRALHKYHSLSIKY